MSRDNYRRFNIQGTLTSQAPLHVGSGTDLETRIPEHAVKVKGMFTDALGSACLPGSSLKGVLHRWALNRLSGPWAQNAGELFGSERTGEEMGGRLTFIDAPIERSCSGIPPLFQSTGGQVPTPLYWDNHRFSYVMASTAINRVTGTVRKNKLYHFEVVPTGTAFQVEIHGEALTDEELALLLESLEQFNSPDGLSVGGFVQQGFGRMKWMLEGVSAIRTESELKDWLAGTQTAFQRLPSIPRTQLDDLRQRFPVTHSSNSSKIALDLEIIFEGPFLVNDPSVCTKHKSSKGEEPDYTFLRASEGTVLLPAKSMRGPLRGQAERILRTLGKEACHIDNADTACRPISNSTEVERLCPACRLFGGNGWRSPIHITDFHLVGNEHGARQEFVAVDRFTGGGAEGKKFNARYVLEPKLRGGITIDLNRIRIEHAGLLAHTLRDLIEGDIPFGFGKSKGFGACRARISQIALPERYPPWLEAVLRDVSSALDIDFQDILGLARKQRAPGDLVEDYECTQVLEELVRAFDRFVQEE